MPRALGAFYHVWKWHNVQTSEIGDAPLYNSCSLPIQVMTTGPLPAPSKCKSRQFNAPKVIKRKSPGTDIVFGVVSSEGHIMPPHIFESQHQSVPGCTEECGGPLVKSGGRWQTLGVAAGLDTGPQVQRDPGLASEGVLRLCTLLSFPPPPPTCTRWTTSFGHTSRTSPTCPPTTRKPAWSPPSAAYYPSFRRGLWKRHAPSSRSVSRRWLKLKAATLNRCQLYYIIKLPELIFFNKSFQIKL